uniref:NADH-ubiquinone oxidoreductase chain 6 n=1 Tax=Scantius aegyptius rossii TaxID=2813040 RepID=A0A8T9ZXK0_9HEMI|nr:NADH dehydrogenase subunit 6 [Scantius aegyptius rossii]
MLMLMNIISIMLIQVNHPISMGLLIIAQTMNISLIIGLISGSFWLSYIIIIVMLSGMLVLFIYMASIASNEKFYSNIKFIYLMFISISLGMLLQWMLEPVLMENTKLQNTNNLEMLLMINMINNNKIIILMVLYLFFSMFIISSIVNVSEGPLRVNK